MYPVAVFCGMLFLGWAHTHTDEVPLVLGLCGIVSGLLGGIFPARLAAIILLLGWVPFAAETLVHFGLLPAPYATGAGLPWPALIAFIPVAAGAALGAAASRGYSTR